MHVDCQSHKHQSVILEYLELYKKIDADDQNLGQTQYKIQSAKNFILAEA